MTADANILPYKEKKIWDHTHRRDWAVTPTTAASAWSTAIKFTRRFSSHDPSTVTTKPPDSRPGPPPPLPLSEPSAERDEAPLVPSWPLLPLPLPSASVSTMVVSPTMSASVDPSRVAVNRCRHQKDFIARHTGITDRIVSAQKSTNTNAEIMP